MKTKTHFQIEEESFKIKKHKKVRPRTNSRQELKQIVKDYIHEEY